MTIRFFLPAGLAATALALGACSSSNDGHPDFPRIEASALEAAMTEPATLSGDSLATQIALIYDALIDPDGHDDVNWDFADAEQGGGNCPGGGHIAFDEFEGGLGSPYTDDAMEISRVRAYGCTRVERTTFAQLLTVGELAYGENEDAVSGRYGGYRMQRMTASSTGLTDLRVEIDGHYDSGALEPIVIPGEDEEAADVVTTVNRLDQLLSVINHIEVVIVTDPDEEGNGGGMDVSESAFAQRYGHGDEPLRATVFTEQDGTQTYVVQGRLASASTLDEDCASGFVDVITAEDMELTMAGSNVTGGRLEISAGGSEATLDFESNGDVSYTDADGGAGTLSRSEIQTLRSACIRKNPIRR